MINPRSRSFRLVCPPERIPQVEALLHAQGFEFEAEPFSPLCRRLRHEPMPLGSSLAAFFGCVYIQDRSSMLPPLALNPQVGARVVDMCASPGSKTGFLAQLTGPQGFVLGNEPTRPRLATLRANLQALHFLHAATCSYGGEALPLLPESWDFIQLDPPCSGWGTSEKNPHVLELWKGEKITPLIVLQKKLLEKAASLLKVGGRLVYSTCTTNVAENEAQVRYAVEELGLEVLPLPPFEGFVWEEPHRGGEGTLRVDGARSQAQGFYIACFTKRGGALAPDRILEPGAAEAEGRQGADGNRRAVNGEIAKGGAESGAVGGGAFASEIAWGAAPPAPAIPTPVDAAGLLFNLKAHQCLNREHLGGDCLDLSQLPPGHLAVFGDTVRFIPQPALECLPASLTWQGANVGKWAGGKVHFSPRLRSLLPSAPPENALQLDDVSHIVRLLSGQSLQTGLRGTDTGLYWQGLPLGRVKLKSGRVLWTGK